MKTNKIRRDRSSQKDIKVPKIFGVQVEGYCAPRREFICVGYPD